VSVRVRRVLLLTFAALLVAVGGLWTFQGLGYIDGGSMSDAEIWAIIGPLVAGLGVALAMVAFKPSD
jgi:NO-binding membrane sensor protein with MHYT domain